MTTQTLQPKLIETEMSKTIKTKVKGVNFENRQGLLIHFARAIDEGKKYFVTLRREKNNTHDPNAIKVWAVLPETKTYMPVGFISKELAKELAPLMDAGKRVWVKTFEILGGRGLTYGLLLTITIS